MWHEAHRASYVARPAVTGSASVVVVLELVDVTEVEVVVEVLVDVEVEVDPHGQSSGTDSPTAVRRHSRASVADTGREPFGAHRHSVSQVSVPTAAPRRKRQSVAVGGAAPVTGAAHPSMGSVVLVEVLEVEDVVDVDEVDVLVELGRVVVAVPQPGDSGSTKNARFAGALRVFR